MHAATPLALSLRLTRCERTSQSNGKQTIQSTTRSHLAKSSYRSFVFEIHSTYVEVPTHIVSSIVRFVPPQESTYREAAAFVHQDDRGLQYKVFSNNSKAQRSSKQQKEKKKCFFFLISNTFKGEKYRQSCRCHCLQPGPTGVSVLTSLYTC